MQYFEKWMSHVQTTLAPVIQVQYKNKRKFCSNLFENYVSNNINTKIQYKNIYLLKYNKNIAEKPEIQEFNETTSTTLSPEEEIEALNEKLRLDLNFGNETHEENNNDSGHKTAEYYSGTEFCENQQYDDLLFRDDKMMKRLTQALFALKLGSFRDLMLGPQVVSGFGHV